MTPSPRYAGRLLLIALTFVYGCATGEPEDELPSLDLDGGPNFPLEAHLESEDIAEGRHTVEEIVEAGAELFHTPYNGLDGVGIARRPDGTPLNRFGAAPIGGGAGGAVSSQSCGECHNHPFGGAAGLASSNRAGDLDNDGVPPFVQRATTSLWGNGIVQLLAQEITEDLHAIRDEASTAAAAEPGTRVERELTSKGISYGTIAATADASGEVTVDVSGREGIDPDLVVRPLGWKGHFNTARLVAAGAAAGLMGMVAEELAWFPPPGAEYDPDPDGDGVERELSVGDVTALTVYGVTQETPLSVRELAERGMVQMPDAASLARVDRGREVFDEVGCATCHTPRLELESTIFEEPTLRGNGSYYNRRLAERDAGYDPERPVRFDLTQVAEQPRLAGNPDGGATVHSYGDLKRHDMGRVLSDPPGPQPPITADAVPLFHEGEMVLIGPSEFLTPELWGVADTGPWLHDARAGTLDEAIRFHGEDDPPPAGADGRSEAQKSRDGYVALGEADREALLTFLRSLRSYREVGRRRSED